MDVGKFLYKELVLLVYESYAPTDNFEPVSFHIQAVKSLSQLSLSTPPEADMMDSTSTHLSGL